MMRRTLVVLLCLVAAALAFPADSYDNPYLTIKINRPDSTFGASVSKVKVNLEENGAASYLPFQDHVPPFLAFAKHSYEPKPYAPAPAPYKPSA